MTSRIDLRSIAEAITEHADAITAYAKDPTLSPDVVRAEALGRAYLIEARLGRLRAAATLSGRGPVVAPDETVLIEKGDARPRDAA